jgi:predicted  nucleic acid-binding Zn-ribbon protein
VVAIDKQIAQETQTLNTQLKQQVKTVEGVTAQTQSYNKVLNDLNNETKKAVLGQKKLDKEVGKTSNNIKKSTKSLRSNVRQLQAFRSLLTFGLGGFRWVCNSTF